MTEKTYVFNVQRYSLHDGPGIRTIVFLKGCPLRCRWCSNPESQRFEREVSYVENRCIGHAACGLCSTVCPPHAIRYTEDGLASLNRKACTDCLACAMVCPAHAIKVEGNVHTVEEILDLVERDAAFYRRGNGGLTVSGGEPLSHPEFLISLLQGARQRRIHTAIETCGYAPYSTLHQAAQHLNFILYDVKTMDEQRHLIWTGKSNAPILENLQHLCQDYPALPKLVRTPVIPGFNDAPEDLEAIDQYLAGLPGVTHQLLPYHTYGKGKYKALGRIYEMEEEG